ncbi:hypothetical protein Ancab_019116 [Ancistrocladus abbreviatus]
MARLAVSQVYVGVPVGSDYSLKRSTFETSNLSFCSKTWTPSFKLDLKAKNIQLRSHSVTCLSVQQATAPKVAVSPLELENAKEPSMHIYKNKQPYTATIVSAERLVGPKSSGETCHIVMDHGGKLPYWEGQSYGVIPPAPLER